MVTGGNGFLGSWVTKLLKEQYNVPAENIYIPKSREWDLRLIDNAINLLRGKDIVINLAAKVGGIGYNQRYPGSLFYDNIMIGSNIIEAARINNTEKVVQVGTVCSYPKFANVPFDENDLWNGYPEETNAPYGVAKKALIVMADAYFRQYGLRTINPILVNLYGPGDNFSLESSHVIPALIYKIYSATVKKANSVEVWGTGKASREFVYVQDAARGIILATMRYDKVEPVNIGSGQEIKIKDLTELISDKLKFKGSIKWDHSKPDGQPRRKLNIIKALSEFDFKAETDLDTGLDATIKWYLSNIKHEES